MIVPRRVGELRAAGASPTAYTPGALVAYWSSTWTNPRASSATPPASHPQVVGVRAASGRDEEMRTFHDGAACQPGGDVQDDRRGAVALALELDGALTHAVTNVGTGNWAELATYVVEKGKPLIALAK